MAIALPASAPPLAPPLTNVVHTEPVPGPASTGSVVGGHTTSTGSVHAGSHDPNAGTPGTPGGPNAASTRGTPVGAPAMGTPSSSLWRSGVMPADPARPTHYAWEPGIATGPGNVLWAVADHCQLVQQFGACQITTAGAPRQPDAVYVWRSTDGGRSWTYAADPIRLPGPGSVLSDAPGGIDSDIAVAPQRSPGGHALIYVVSNWIGGFEMAVSADGGRTWVTTEITGFAFTDRPWIAASGPCTLYLTVHPASGAFDVASVPVVARYNGCAMVARSHAGLTVAPPTSVSPIQPLSNDVAATDQVFAKPVVVGSRVYVPYVACNAPATVALTDPGCNAPGDTETLAVAISDRGGRSFRDVIVARGHLGINLNDGTWPLSLAVDRSGAAVLVADTGYALIAYNSLDAGRSWSPSTSPAAALHWPFAGIPAVAVAGNTYTIGWYASPAAAPGGRQDYYLAAAGGSLQQRRSRVVDHLQSLRVLPVVLARLPAGTPLGDTLSDDFAAALVSGHPVFVLVQSCAGSKAADPACPGLPANAGRALVTRYAWLR
ncbi:MAG: hypothetical protein ACYCV7_17020 [Acidimicrobiales bacterium]